MKTAISIALLGLAAGAAGLPTLAAAQARAPEAGPYIGAALGQSKAKSACSDLGAIGFVGNCDDNDLAWKVFGGYQFNRYWGVEVGYVDMGEFDASGTFGGLPASAKSDATAFELTVVGTVPLGERFSIYGKAGVHRWDVDSNAVGGGVTGSVSDDGIDFTYGVGLNFHFNRNVALRAEWQRYSKVGDSSTTGQSNVNVISAGVVYKF